MYIAALHPLKDSRFGPEFPDVKTVFEVSSILLWRFYIYINKHSGLSPADFNKNYAVGEKAPCFTIKGLSHHLINQAIKSGNTGAFLTIFIHN